MHMLGVRLCDHVCACVGVCGFYWGFCSGSTGGSALGSTGGSALGAAHNIICN